MKTAILVSSCDAFSDCWLPMIHSFKKYWPDCEYPIYFVTNFKSIDEKGITFIKVGQDKGFGSNMNKALELIEVDTVILFLDDYFLNKCIKNTMIRSHITYFIKESIDFLKIDYHDIIYRDENRIGNSFYCENPLDLKYSVNTAIALWKKEVLKSLCVEGISAWDFERNGISNIKKKNLHIKSATILSTSIENNTIKKISGPGAVCKGRWTMEGIEFLKKNGFSSLISKREIEGKFTRYITSLYSPNSILWLPFGLILRIIQKLKINI
jgi:hypothetical protein